MQGRFTHLSDLMRSRRIGRTTMTTRKIWAKPQNPDMDDFRVLNRKGKLVRVFRNRAEPMPAGRIMAKG